MDIDTDTNLNAVLAVTDDHDPPRPARVDGVPVWASSDETVLKVTPADDGMSALIETVAPGGPARVTVTGDADLGEGVLTLTGVTEDINVAQGPAGQATTFTLGLTATPKA